MAFYYNPTFLEFIRYIDYFSSDKWESLCKTKYYSQLDYNEQARKILTKRIKKFTELQDSSQFSEEVNVWSNQDISINYSLSEGLFYRLNNEKLDLKFSQIFPKYYK